MLTQTAHEVEGLSLRLLLRQRKRVVRHSLLDRLPHLRRGTEESIRRHRTPDPLVRTPEVVGLDEEGDAALAIVEVREDRPREKLLPQGLPEALDLAQGLRVVRPALDVPDALTAQLLLEVGVATPRHVLTPLVREDLPWRAVLRDPSRQRFQHQGRPLVVRQHQRHKVARVVVHEGRHVEAVMPPEEKRENVRLPELIRLRAFEAVLEWTRLGRSLGYCF